MTADSIPPAPRVTTPAPEIHEAERESGASGAVLRGVVLAMPAAVARRRAGQDVVVCGLNVDANRRLAYQLESNVGPAMRPQPPHTSAGPMALPHIHQMNRSPAGHTFYETDKRKAKKMP